MGFLGLDALKTAVYLGVNEDLRASVTTKSPN